MRVKWQKRSRLTPCHGSAGTGLRKRRLSIGGFANGIPWKTWTSWPSTKVDEPRIGPLLVCTTSLSMIPCTWHTLIQSHRMQNFNIFPRSRRPRHEQDSRLHSSSTRRHKLKALRCDPSALLKLFSFALSRFCSGSRGRKKLFRFATNKKQPPADCTQIPFSRVAQSKWGKKAFRAFSPEPASGEFVPSRERKNLWLRMNFKLFHLFALHFTDLHDKSFFTFFFPFRWFESGEGRRKRWKSHEERREKKSID